MWNITHNTTHNNVSNDYIQKLLPNLKGKILKTGVSWAAAFSISDFFTPASSDFSQVTNNAF